MPTAAELIELVREAAHDRATRDLLAGSLSTTDTAVTMDSGEDVSDQARLSIDLETMLVVDKSTIVSTANVSRGYEGTTAAPHADNTPVYINPRFTAHQYLTAINRALDAISVAFGKSAWDAASSFSSSVGALAIPATAIRVHTVGYVPTGQTTLIPVSFTEHFSLPTGVLSGGRGVLLGGYNPGTGTAYIGYETTWPTLTALSSSLDSAFPSNAQDLIWLGALAYLSESEAFSRVAFAEPHVKAGSFNATEAGVRVQAAAHLQRFIARRSELAARYRHMDYGWVKHG